MSSTLRFALGRARYLPLPRDVGLRKLHAFQRTET
jgi:hypothetical protein